MAIINSEDEIPLTDEGMLDLLENINKKIKQDEIKNLKNEVKNEVDVIKKRQLIAKMTEIKKELENI